MALKDWLEARESVKSLKRVAVALEQQNVLLAMLVAHLVPKVPEASQRDLVPLGGVYTQDREQARILDFVEKSRSDIGRDPTDEEIAAFLDGTPV